MSWIVLVVPLLVWQMPLKFNQPAETPPEIVTCIGLDIEWNAALAFCRPTHCITNIDIRLKVGAATYGATWEEFRQWMESKPTVSVKTGH